MKDENDNNSQYLYNTLKGIELNLQSLEEQLDIRGEHIVLFIFINNINSTNGHFFTEEDLVLNLFNIDNFTRFNNNNFELLLNDYILYKNLNKISIYDNINKIDKKKSFQERKGDWVCLLCINLNFAFRTKCNICGSNKEESAKIII